ncbi:PIN domain-containing protein [Gloeocapsa sp. BRSZ]
MRILIDTNIILDYLLRREPFCQKADLLFQVIASDQIVGYVTATTLTDIFYIARHTGSIEQARQAISETLTAMVIFPVNRAVLESAFASDLTDLKMLFS